jgi:hypothetical protein
MGGAADNQSGGPAAGPDKHLRATARHTLIWCPLLPAPEPPAAGREPGSELGEGTPWASALPYSGRQVRHASCRRFRSGAGAIGQASGSREAPCSTCWFSRAVPSSRGTSLRSTWTPLVCSTARGCGCLGGMVTARTVSSADRDGAPGRPRRGRQPNNMRSRRHAQMRFADLRSDPNCRASAGPVERTAGRSNQVICASRTESARGHIR